MSRAGAAARVLEAARLTGLLRRLGAWRGGVLALSYHRIGDASASPFDRALFSADAETFDRQLAVLAREAEIVQPADLLDVSRLGAGRYVLITFDDGYRDAHDVALPLLRSRGLPATFFVSTSFLDDPRPAWWDELAWMVRASERSVARVPGLDRPLALEPDRERAVRVLTGTYASLPSERAEALLDAAAHALGTGRCPRELAEREWLTWDMARHMRDAGMTIGGHTATHPILARACPERQRDEIAVCGRRLREELGEPMRFFSYPVGLRDAFDGETRALVSAAGVQIAFSDYGGSSSFRGWDRLDVRRASPPSTADARLLRATVALPRAFARW
jgi:peptidoglycan/xylan/chitin deacetylase (PgdA/CDA1 family)